MSYKLVALAKSRVKELADHYATPLPELPLRVARFEAKLAAHRAKMGRN